VRCGAGMGSGANAAVGMAAHGEAEAAGADGKRSALARMNTVDLINTGGGAAAATRGVWWRLRCWTPQKWELIIIVLTVAP